MSTMAEAKKKERSTNWSDKEITALIEEVAREKNRLFQPLSSFWTAKKRTELWMAICQRVNSVGSCRREKEQIKKKWTNLRSAAISFRSRRKNPPTGGGPPETPEWWMEKVMNILEDDFSEVMDGIDPEGGESFTLAPPEVMYDSDCENIHNPQVPSAVKDTAYVAPLIKKDFTLPPAVYASTPLKASCSNTPGDGPTSQNSTSLLDHLSKKRKRQNNTTECTTNAKYMKTLQLLDCELDRVKKESQLLDIKITNERLSQLKAYYELKMLENTLAIPAAESVNEMIGLDIAALPKSN